MTRALLIGLVTLCCVWSQDQQSKPAAQPAYSKEANDVIHQWEHDTKATVAPEARAQIARDSDQMDWSTVFLPAENRDQALAWTKDALVKAYLYAVWDRDRAQLTITKAAVDGYTLSEFIASLKSVSEPFGIVEFLSAPAGATIKRDQQEIGHTPLGLVVAGPEHVYDIVLSKEITCESTIQVRPGTTDRMTCPE